MMRKPHYFAIGLRGWVEIRYGQERPTPVVSQCSRTVKKIVHEGYINALGQFRVRYKETEKPLVFKVVVYEGGQVMKTVPLGRFAERTGKWVDEDKMIVLPESVNTVIEQLVNGD